MRFLGTRTAGMTPKQIKPLPDECPSPASGRHRSVPFWEGVEHRRAGTHADNTTESNEYLTAYVRGWNDQHDLARAEGYA